MEYCREMGCRVVNFMSYRKPQLFSKCSDLSPKQQF